MMKKDAHLPWDCTGCLRAAGLLVCFFLSLATAAIASDVTSILPAKDLQGIPDDLTITYDYGSTHAERGRTTYRVSADGAVIYEKTKLGRSAVDRQKENYRLTKEELQFIVKKIRDTGFFRLDKSYSNTKIRDGSSSYITVTMNHTTHSVTVLNTRQRQFDALAETIVSIAGKKKPVK